MAAYMRRLSSTNVEPSRTSFCSRMENSWPFAGERPIFAGRHVEKGSFGSGAAFAPLRIFPMTRLIWLGRRALSTTCNVIKCGGHRLDTCLLSSMLRQWWASTTAIVSTTRRAQRVAISSP